MVMEDRSNTDLLQLWKRGNQHAAQVLVDRYMTRLTALASSRLSQKLSRRIDAEDVVLSAWRSFFVAANRSRLHVPDDDNLWPLLVTLTIRKLQRQAQRHQAECRDIQQERSLDDAESWQEIASSEPTSEHAAQLTQDIETLMDRLEPADREILTFRLQGEKLEAIARQLNCSERTVRRSMQRIRTHLAEHFDLQQPDVDPSVETKPLSGPNRFTPPDDVMADPDHSSEVPAAAATGAPPATERNHVQSNSPTLHYQDVIIEKLIGQGGFGRVYRARLKHNGRIVAVKYLTKRLWHHAAAAKALIDETQKASTISHPQIIRHDGWGLAPSGAPFLMMEYINGPNVGDWAQGPSYDSAEIITCGLQMCDALAALHRAGLLHGDIAPGNILRRSPHDFVLTDFGMSQSVSEVNRSRGGTLSFLAPEQVSSSFGTISQRTDIYGLGALLYFMATGRPPFIGCDAPDVFSQIVSSRPPELIPEACGLPTTLNRLIMNCLTKEPSQRIPSMETLKQAFLD